MKINRNMRPTEGKSDDFELKPVSAAWREKPSDKFDAKPMAPTNSEVEVNNFMSPTERFMFMFFSFPTGGPIAYKLCAVKLPESGGMSQPEPPAVEEVLVLPSKDFPVQMCCFQFDSKFYFLGGNRVHSLELYMFAGNNHPSDVYVFDPSLVGRLDSSLYIKMLVKGPAPMNTGKPSPYALVANRKIYVISPIEYLSHRTAEEVSRFEVFSPDDDGGWVTLPEPPDLGPVFGHAVVGQNIIFSLFSHKIVYFDVKSHRWGLVDGLENFYGVAHYVDDNLYASCEYYLAAFTSSGSKGLPRRGRYAGFPRSGQVAGGVPDFDCMARADVAGRHNHLSSVVDTADNLIHICDQTFCCLKLEDKPDGMGGKIVVFQASIDRGCWDDELFLADIIYASPLVVPISGGNYPDRLIFSDTVSVPFMDEEEYGVKMEALFQRSVDEEVLRQTGLLEEGEEVEEEEEEVGALIQTSADMSKYYGVPITPWGIGKKKEAQRVPTTPGGIGKKKGPRRIAGRVDDFCAGEPMKGSNWFCV